MRNAFRTRWLMLILGWLVAAALSAQPLLRWQEGDAYYYTLSLQTHQRVSFEQIARLMDDAPPSASRPDYVYEYALRATVLIAPIQRIEQDWLLVWKFESPRITLRAGEGTLQNLDARPLQQQVESITLFMRLSPTGEIRALWFTPADAAEAHDLLRAALARLQLRLPNRDSKQWVVEEESPEGRYRAEYTLEQRAEKRLRLQKQRVNYTESASPLPVPQTLKPSDKVQIELQDGILRRIEGRFQTQSLANAKLLASETTTVRFLWRETRRVDAARLQAWRTRYRPLAAKP
ncbi:MAG: hypothetical protein N2651_05110, partial [Fimbriimonadales bacterium]|nr:hypothetical protein [Fimbriimonadales bacterium]